jgi:hypothetical protein
MVVSVASAAGSLVPASRGAGRCEAINIPPDRRKKSLRFMVLGFTQNYKKKAFAKIANA